MTRPCSYLDPRRVERCTECGNVLSLCTCMEVSDKAHARLTSEHGRYLRQVWLELSQWQGPQDHVFEKLVAALGQVGEKLVQNMDNQTPSESEIQRDLVKVGVLLTLLAADGTPEYSYPSS
jgi:hypothetical protein